MSEKIGLMGALEILGVQEVPRLTRLGVVKMCVQGGGQMALMTDQPPLLISSFVGISVDFPVHPQNTVIESRGDRYQAFHEMLQGTLYMQIDERYIDTAGNLRGHGLDGLATGGGLHHSSYGLRVK